ncbi:MAG TPA: hypothetical protein VN258_15390 [Mobilitalea sp.]|nr:hypothetical protein [Mobilitalea sp.]
MIPSLTKRNLQHSEELFRYLEDKYRLNSLEGEIAKKNYMRISNTYFLPQDAALQIKNYFQL